MKFIQNTGSLRKTKEYRPIGILPPRSRSCSSQRTSKSEGGHPALGVSSPRDYAKIRNTTRDHSVKPGQEEDSVKRPRHRRASTGDLLQPLSIMAHKRRPSSKYLTNSLVQTH